MAASLATVNHVEMLQRELQAPGKGFNSGSQFSLRQGSKLVEQGLDECRVDDLDEDSEDEAVVSRSALV